MTFGVLLTVVYTLGLASLFFARAESLPEALPAYTRAERWAVIVTPLLVALHVTLACVAVSRTPIIAGGVAAASLVVFAGGWTFWIWARTQIGPLGTTRRPDEPPPRLRRDGPFGLVRNPLYLGLLVMIVAPVIVVPRPLFGVTFLLCVGALNIRAAQEERRLHAQLGAEYAAYCRAVPRLVPFLW